MIKLKTHRIITLLFVLFFCSVGSVFADYGENQCPTVTSSLTDYYVNQKTQTEHIITQYYNEYLKLKTELNELTDNIYWLESQIRLANTELRNKGASLTSLLKQKRNLEEKLANVKSRISLQKNIIKKYIARIEKIENEVLSLCQNEFPSWWSFEENILKIIKSFGYDDTKHIKDTSLEKRTEYSAPSSPVVDDKDIVKKKRKFLKNA